MNYSSKIIKFVVSLGLLSFCNSAEMVRSTDSDLLSIKIQIDALISNIRFFIESRYTDAFEVCNITIHKSKQNYNEKGKSFMDDVDENKAHFDNFTKKMLNHTECETLFNDLRMIAQRAINQMKQCASYPVYLATLKCSEILSDKEKTLSRLEEQKEVLKKCDSLKCVLKVKSDAITISINIKHDIDNVLLIVNNKLVTSDYCLQYGMDNYDGELRQRVISDCVNFAY